MTDSNIKRKSAAGMFTDIAGYTNIMAKDESKALSLLQDKRKIIKPLIEEYEGIYVKGTGDGTLSYFDSAYKASMCAKTFQGNIYDNDNIDVPLVEQMLKFWQFTEEEMSDSQPEMYWSDEEKELGDAIIHEASDGSEFGCLLMSDRFGTQYGKHHQETYDKDVQNFTNILTEYQLPYFYYTSKPISETPFNWVNKILDMKQIDLRIQLYIKSKAKINLSNQCGTNHLVVRYSKCFESQRQFPLAHNFVKGEIYL